MLKLSGTFENSLGKMHHWSFSDPNKDLTSAEVRVQLEKLSELALFEKDGAQLFTHVTSAKFVEVIETPLF
ncbi:DUF2922 domain-containing protein [Enterococcus xiangfangensis]|uniref:DUF2922 domain-containing protein n=1 Tax=Enterococcus xiangfangensis TaxID=1296537 RepID=A0ABU3F866_9ENTE|nr:DUF2922 domain-containing protein [Enterococcus xiangfangensis]MBM7710842.1 hypothetical protein [Enterococcus xiangfangensis]MDT2758631.1 DUF2922 domain-containing protein [Enterococcus xiangfangensis]NBK08286.1 DUF2922 domain-containing protein [Enterococcus asini]